MYRSKLEMGCCTQSLGVFLQVGMRTLNTYSRPSHLRPSHDKCAAIRLATMVNDKLTMSAMRTAVV